MELEPRCGKKLLVGSVEKLTLPFVPVCDLTHDIAMPCLPGSKIVEIDFSASLGASSSAEDFFPQRLS